MIHTALSKNEKLRKELSIILERKIMQSYSELSKWQKNIKASRMSWHSYISGCVVSMDAKKLEKGGTSLQVSIQPIRRYVPNLRMKSTTGLFNLENLIDFSLKDVQLDMVRLFGSHKKYCSISINNVQDAILCALEADSMKIPSQKLIKSNIRNIMNNFVPHVQSKLPKVRSVAPFVGANLDTDLTFDGILFKNPDKTDIANLVTIECNITGEMSEFHFDYDEPILILEHEFNFSPDPHNYELAYSIDNLHQTFKSKTRDIVSAIRLNAEKRIGIAFVYHSSADWKNLSSFNWITEDASPVYKPIEFGRHSLDKSEFTDTKQKLVANEITRIYQKIISARSKVAKHPEYSELLTATNAYSKSMDESDVGWTILDLAIGLEALCKFQNIRRGRRGNCESSNGIYKTLGVLSNKSLIEEVYRARSEGFAHSSPESYQVNLALIPRAREYLRCTILEFLGNAL